MAEKIIAVIGARLNSSRLPRKHLLSLAGEPMISHIVKRLQQVELIDDIIIATTADDYNIPLKEWALSSGVDCYAHTGDVDDLVGRIDAVVQKADADVLLYVCGDCPLIEPETINNKLKAIKNKHSVDLVQLSPLPPEQKYIHEGFDVYRRSFWDQMVACAELPFEREHIGAVYHSLGKVAPQQIAYVDEDEIYSSIQHRISVDTPTDYRFMREVYSRWSSLDRGQDIVDLKWVIEQLSKDGDLRAMNGFVRQKGVEDKSPSISIYAEAGKDAGLGHLSRMMAAATILQDRLSAKVRLIIQGDPVEFDDLDLIDHLWVQRLSSSVVLNTSEAADLCIFDLKSLSDDLAELLKAKSLLKPLVGVDFGKNYEDMFDHNWVPSFYLPKDRQKNNADAISYGWDTYLLRTFPKMKREGGVKKLLVLTGGSDPAKLSAWLPELLVGKIGDTFEIQWVQGSYAQPPSVPAVDNSVFKILKAPVNIPQLISASDMVLCQYGVSFFEAIKAGVNTVGFDVIGAATNEEQTYLKTHMPETFYPSVEEAVNAVSFMSANTEMSECFINYSTKMSKAPERFAHQISMLLKASS
ncbi:NTP transferase domain-containing protein [Kordiimonas sp. SCSIO 12603]|uniref:cytidylyltransferase domain-containing protein n=1 Tax=Kordiimonas sp. SCSIO 12603 TaxID=2829596 RepID=UPI002104BF69|nr:NTP transferase domain-containing protein [Kordiimonas sp. SCSIO 12603]UTW57627.1 NTP transferase domain-containing protein [Kordiimonas sp. SCSIO 12603]